MKSLEEHAYSIRRQSGPMVKLSRAVDVLKHYRWSQIARRIRNILLKKMRPLVGGVAIVEPVVVRRELFARFEKLASTIIETENRSRSIWDQKNSRLTLLNHTAEVNGQIDWQNIAEPTPQLWKFQLHYHEYLLTLAGENAVAQTTNCLASWIDQFDPETTSRKSDSWHPYCISRRLPVWVWLISSNAIADDSKEKILKSLCQQAEFLSQNLETDLGGNHLFENLVTLAVCAIFVDSPDADRWFSIAKDLLKRELPAQIHEDGEHFELSPMYHCQMLGILARLTFLCQEFDLELFHLCELHLRKMWLHLTSVLHPDGLIPLFSDSGFDEGPTMQQLSALLELIGARDARSDQEDYQPANYRVFSDYDFGDRLIFDVGEVGAAGLPAHAHCDLLNFELSLGGRRWIVDSGNYNYLDDSMRYYCRSSVAHNVCTIDGQNSCDIWSKFRMGRRGRILDVTDRLGPCQYSIASHDGYRGLGCARMGRMMGHLRSERAFVCVDSCSGRDVDMVGYLHLAPGIEVKELMPDGGVLADDTGLSANLAFFGVDSVDIVPGWYCPAFGERIRANVVRYRKQLAQSNRLGWILCVKNSKFRPSMRFRGNDCEIEFGPTNYSFSLELN